ncbi:Membrane-anchored ubiquitin-fold protein 3 [Ranunculus cassubicifolius]
MAAEELVELKFRLSDGTDIGPNKYNTTISVGSLKEVIVSQWPQDKQNGPKTINDVKLINGGKILENNRSLAESRVQIGEVPGGVITMHVVVQPPLPDKKSEKLLAKSPKNRCLCSIL